MADGDDDDHYPVMFDPAEYAVILYAIAPVALEIAAEGFAEGGGIGRAFDALFQETLYVRSG
jgi:hypothetical protein